MLFFAFAFGMILSSLLTQYGQENETIATSDLLFMYRGVDITIEQIADEDKALLMSINKEKNRYIENAALRYYFLDTAQRSQKSIDEVINEAMPWEAVSEQEISRFYESNQSTLNKPLAEIRDVIHRKLEKQKIQAAKSKLLNQLMQQGDLVLYPL